MSAHPLQRWLVESAIIMAAHTLTALVVMHMQSGPGGANLLWLPAGIALAAALLRGAHALPAIFIATAGFHFYALFSGGPSSLQAIAATVVTSLGSTVQAWLTAWLLHKWTRNLHITTVADALRFVCATSAGAVIAASVGTLGLLAQHKIGLDTTTLTWLTWWVGDLTGMLVVAPIILVVRSWRRGRRDWSLLSLPIIGIGCSFTLTTAFIVKHLDNDAAIREFMATSRAMGDNLQRNLDFAMHDLMAANAVFYNTELDPIEFHNFTKQLKRNNALIRTITWAPRVVDSDVEKFERQAEKVLKTPFRIFDVDSHMRPITRQKRAEYFPIFMAEPPEIRSVAGANLISHPNRAAAIALARSTGRPQAAGTLHMMVGSPAIPIYWPVYANEYRQDSATSDPDDLRGFVGITIEVAKLTETTFKPYESAGMDIWLVDATSEEQETLIYGHTQLSNEAALVPDLALVQRKTHFISKHDFAGRNWLLISRPATEHSPLQANGQFIGILLSGFGLTFALAIYMIGRQRSEDALRARDERLMSQNAILTQVARFGMAQGQDIDAQLRELIATSAGTLHVERVSLWLEDDDGTCLRCRTLFTRSTGVFSNGMTLNAADAPNYFRALHEGRGFAADDAQNDPRTSEFTDTYLRPLGITSMMDVPVRISGKPAGVICHEHMGTPRNWAADEQNFAASIGDLASLVLESAGRQDAEKALQDAYQALEIKVEERTEELRKANERLRQLDQLKSMFIASMSHELRTPLNSIIGFTGVVLQGISGTLNDKQRDHLQRVYGSARHLLALITDVIDISKIEAGYADTYFDTFSLNLLIDEAAATIQPQRIDKGLGIEIHATEKIDVHTDRQRLLQALLNLLSNAVKYSERGTICINLLSKDEHIVIEVIDSGIGITPDAMSKLFQPFERIDTHLRIKTPGTGLGLYLTRKIMTDLLHGDVEAESTPGKGSVFRLWIPHKLSSGSSDTNEGNV